MGWHEAVACGIGILIGTALWYPYRWRLGRLLNRRREAQAILKELAEPEYVHTEEPPTQNPFPFNPNPGAVYRGYSYGGNFPVPGASSSWTATQRSAPPAWKKPATGK